MKKYNVTSDEAILFPETVEESGLLQWIAKRYEGQRVTLHFDTGEINGCEHHPAFWIRPEEPPKDKTLEDRLREAKGEVMT